MKLELLVFDSANYGQAMATATMATTMDMATTAMITATMVLSSMATICPLHIWPILAYSHHSYGYCRSGNCLMVTSNLLLQGSFIVDALNSTLQQSKYEQLSCT